MSLGFLPEDFKDFRDLDNGKENGNYYLRFRNLGSTAKSLPGTS